jgi:hypothetical protein
MKSTRRLVVGAAVAVAAAALWGPTAILGGITFNALD